MIKSAFAEVDETKSCTIVYEKGCCDELFGQRSFVMLIIFFVTHALIYISKRNLTNHTWCVEFVSRFATHMSLLTNNTIKVKKRILAPTFISDELRVRGACLLRNFENADYQWFQNC